MNYDALQMILYNIPVICQLKINSVLTVAIAFDRFTALQWPIRYKFKRKGPYASGKLDYFIVIICLENQLHFAVHQTPTYSAEHDE